MIPVRVEYVADGLTCGFTADMINGRALGARPVLPKWLRTHWIVTPATVRRILCSHRIPPPARSDATWRTFLGARAETPPATDLFHVEGVVTFKRRYVTFVIEIDSRRVHLLGITERPHRAAGHLIRA